MKVKIKSAKKLIGEIQVPGDKSISHRSIILGALASGETYVENFLMSRDCIKTISIFRQMGVSVEIVSDQSIIINGKGLFGLTQPNKVLYAGNSGTTARLVTGVLCGQRFMSSITGDPSLNMRPMDRIIVPLKNMNAAIEGKGKHLPLFIKPSNLIGIDYTLPVASAQIKSALILAGLYAASPTTIHQPVPSRNHTEIMLKEFGAHIYTTQDKITVFPDQNLEGQHVPVPGDISSAAFLITAALLIPGSCLTIKNVGINETRTGILDIYKKMGANIKIENNTEYSGEKRADITVKYSALNSTTIEGDLIPRAIDEFPVIALAATQALGTTIIKDAGELKIKESNRIANTVHILSCFGAAIQETDDGMIINGPSKLKGNIINIFKDHRLGMTASIGGMVAQGETIIDDAQWVSISFPNFFTSGLFQPYIEVL